MTYQTELQSLVHEDNAREERATNKTCAVGGLVLLMVVFFLAGQSSGRTAYDCFDSCMLVCLLGHSECSQSCKSNCGAVEARALPISSWYN